jgi:hypothetical protein
MKYRTRAVVAESAATRPSARRLAAVRQAATVAAWGLLAALAPGTKAQATVFILPAALHAGPAHPQDVAGRSAARAAPAAGADGAARTPGAARHGAQPVPSPAATATAASAEARAAIAPAGELPSSQTWALLGGVLLAVCMIARRQQQQA